MTTELSLTGRTAFLVGVAGLTAGVCLISAASSLQLLWLAAPLAGFAFGCHWSLMPPLASELFGMPQIRHPVLPAAVRNHLWDICLCHPAGASLPFLPSSLSVHRLLYSEYMMHGHGASMREQILACCAATCSLQNLI